MKERCRSESRPGYHGRGIIVCSEWENSFLSFKDYVMTLPNAMGEGLTLDRIDNNSNYEPGNMRWTDAHVQGLNRRVRKNMSGFTGVYYQKKDRIYRSEIVVHNEIIRLGSFVTAKAAAIVRDLFIIKNALYEYRLQVLTPKTK